MARRQRRRGVSLTPESVRAPSLTVFGEQDGDFSPSHYRSVAIYLAGDAMAVPETGHWGIVCHRVAVALTAPRVDDWLKANVSQE